MLLSEKNVPKVFPATLRRRFGDFHATLHLRVVRLWRISATQILGLNNTQLLPWIPLLDASVDDIEEALARLKSVPDPSLTARLVLLGGLRYGSKEAFLQRLNQMILSDEILQDSSTYHFILEQGV